MQTLYIVLPLLLQYTTAEQFSEECKTKYGVFLNLIQNADNNKNKEAIRSAFIRACATPGGDEAVFRYAITPPTFTEVAAGKKAYFDQAENYKFVAYVDKPRSEITGRALETIGMDWGLTYPKDENQSKQWYEFTTEGENAYYHSGATGLVVSCNARPAAYLIQKVPSSETHPNISDLLQGHFQRNCGTGSETHFQYTFVDGTVTKAAQPERRSGLLCPDGKGSYLSQSLLYEDYDAEVKTALKTKFDTDCQTPSALVGGYVYTRAAGTFTLEKVLTKIVAETCGSLNGKWLYQRIYGNATTDADIQTIRKQFQVDCASQSDDDLFQYQVSSGTATKLTFDMLFLDDTCTGRTNVRLIMPYDDAGITTTENNAMKAAFDAVCTNSNSERMLYVYQMLNDVATLIPVQYGYSRPCADTPTKRLFTALSATSLTTDQETALDTQFASDCAFARVSRVDYFYQLAAGKFQTNNATGDDFKLCAASSGLVTKRLLLTTANESATSPSHITAKITKFQTDCQDATIPRDTFIYTMQGNNAMLSPAQMPFLLERCPTLQSGDPLKILIHETDATLTDQNKLDIKKLFFSECASGAAGMYVYAKEGGEIKSKPVTNNYYTNSCTGESTKNLFYASTATINQSDKDKINAQFQIHCKTASIVRADYTYILHEGYPILLPVLPPTTTEVCSTRGKKSVFLPTPETESLPEGDKTALKAHFNAACASPMNDRALYYYAVTNGKASLTDFQQGVLLEKCLTGGQSRLLVQPIPKTGMSEELRQKIIYRFQTDCTNEKDELTYEYAIDDTETETDGLSMITAAKSDSVIQCSPSKTDSKLLIAPSEALDAEAAKTMFTTLCSPDDAAVGYYYIAKRDNVLIHLTVQGPGLIRVCTENLKRFLIQPLSDQEEDQGVNAKIIVKFQVDCSDTDLNRSIFNYTYASETATIIPPSGDDTLNTQRIKEKPALIFPEPSRAINEAVKCTGQKASFDGTAASLIKQGVSHEIQLFTEVIEKSLSNSEAFKVVSTNKGVIQVINDAEQIQMTWRSKSYNAVTKSAASADDEIIVAGDESQLIPSLRHRVLIDKDCVLRPIVPVTKFFNFYKKQMGLVANPTFTGSDRATCIASADYLTFVNFIRSYGKLWKQFAKDHTFTYASLVESDGSRLITNLDPSQFFPLTGAMTGATDVTVPLTDFIDVDTCSLKLKLDSLVAGAILKYPAEYIINYLLLDNLACDLATWDSAKLKTYLETALPDAVKKVRTIKTLREKLLNGAIKEYLGDCAGNTGAYDTSAAAAVKKLALNTDELNMTNEHDARIFFINALTSLMLSLSEEKIAEYNDKTETKDIICKLRSTPNFTHRLTTNIKNSNGNTLPLPGVSTLLADAPGALQLRPNKFCTSSDDLSLTEQILPIILAGVLSTPEEENTEEVVSPVTEQASAGKMNDVANVIGNHPLLAQVFLILVVHL